MRKHISEEELCELSQAWCGDGHLHKEDFCLLCGYEIEGDRLYMEIHGSNGALNATRDIDGSQPYVCMDCVEQFDVGIRGEIIQLAEFIKEKK